MDTHDLSLDMGPSTQSIIDTCIEEMEETPNLDNFAISEFLLFSPEKDSIPGPSGATSSKLIPELQAESSGSKKAPKSPTKFNKRPKQPKTQECFLCKKNVASMRQHLAKSHTLSEKLKRYYLSIYATKICNNPVYECKDCMIRFVNTQDTKRRHEDHLCLLLKKEEAQTFPPHETITETQATDEQSKSVKFLEEYQDFVKKHGGLELRESSKKYILMVANSSSNFKDLSSLYQKSKEYQIQEKLSAVTMGKRLGELRGYLDYIQVRYKKVFRISKSLIEVHLKMASKKFSKEGKREAHATKELNFSRLPPMELVQQVREKLLAVMQIKNPDTLCYLTIQEQMNVAFFLVHSRTNCRAGGLLQLETSTLMDAGPNKVIRLFKHKTSHKYTNFVYFNNDEFDIISKIHERFEADYQFKSPLVFANTKGQKLTAVSAYLKKVISRYCIIDAFNFGPNSIRKVWDTFREKSNFVPQELEGIYTSNTGHSASTRQEHYTAPATDEEIMRLFNIQSAALQEKMSQTPTENVPTHESSTEPETRHQDAAIEPSTSAINIVEPNLEPPKVRESASEDDVTDEECSESGENDDENSLDNESDSTYVPTTKVAPKKYGKRTMAEKTRGKQSLGAKKLEKKMMHFQNKYPLHTQILKACKLVAQKNKQLTKEQVRTIIRRLNLNEKDEKEVLEVVYKKMCNVFKNHKF